MKILLRILGYGGLALVLFAFYLRSNQDLAVILGLVGLYLGIVAFTECIIKY